MPGTNRQAWSANLPILTGFFDGSLQIPQGYHHVQRSRCRVLIEPLSERELEVLRHLNGPLSTPEIAEQLVVSANTVRTHIKNIFGKLGVHGRSAAVWRAHEYGNTR